LSPLRSTEPINDIAKPAITGLTNKLIPWILEGWTRGGGNMMTLNPPISTPTNP